MAFCLLKSVTCPSDEVSVACFVSLHFCLKPSKALLVDLLVYHRNFLDKAIGQFVCLVRPVPLFQKIG